ncbi:hypothetical protein A3C96_00105 [Candidatus Uhrbacteria bacterium RIFCSPHIGHO2_02_FULL_60_10]|uniref:Glycosyltransferase RgtA/B/C/D-like domain-containing protein n=1 Tax=Candidatus Uhrbacteria bacterium RIFCSPHIGHO2_02_FULL_60_10 TaxID=1802392 RepID=A0A1F7U9S8_9BACT|nr:MAG: hypothetical protein A3C96_00105 [Candidatus Uhrbacteria bacterium RIFCSPHIGHO2_02_FULL_60_10]
MKSSPIFNQYTVFPLILAMCALVALFLPGGPWWRFLLLLAYFGGLAIMLGRALLPGEKFMWRSYLGLLVILSGLTVAGAGAYYLHSLNLTAIATLLLLPPLAVMMLENRWGRRGLASWLKSTPITDRDRQTGPYRHLAWPFAAIFIALSGYALALLLGAATAEAVRSPWDSVPRVFFVVIFLTAVLALGTIGSGLMGHLSWLPAVALAAPIVLVAAVVYTVGLGFDPFIHQSTERTIAAVGVMLPKTLYYVGQYALVTILAKFQGLPPDRLDQFLAPLLFLLALPLAYWSLRRSFGWSRRLAGLAVLPFLAWPLAPFVMTTPQAVADIFAVMVFFAALPALTSPDSADPAEAPLPTWFLVLLTAAAAVVHPLAGIPLAFFTAAVLLAATTPGRGILHRLSRRAAFVLLAVIGSLAVPAVFLLNSRLSTADVALKLDVLRSPTAIIENLKGPEIVARRFQPAFDAAYAWREIRLPVIFTLGAAGLWLMCRRSRAAAAYATATAIFLANFILLKTVLNFSFLIAYERSYYADRLLDLGLFALAPPALYACGRLFELADRRPMPLRIALAVLLAGLITASTYLAYPRRDLYDSSRGWSTSAADIAAVRLIARDAGEEKFVVLANQSVSAAAIREFGFRRYFPSADPLNAEPLFYYPLPTGGRLYAEFEKMNSGLGQREQAEKVMALTGAESVYFVVTNYWWQANKIILSAKRQADRFWSVNNKDFVFRYGK